VSNGGMMVLRIGCDMSDRFVAIAPIVALLPTEHSCGPKQWQNELSEKAGLACTAYSSCRIDGQEVVSCIDEDGGHRWPAQRPQGPSATCVTQEQYSSMPGQPHCETRTVGGEHTGMDLVWEFFSKYSR
jgi:poly(3-hydroxybutyrate) depolymerase